MLALEFVKMSLRAIVRLDEVEGMRHHPDAWGRWIGRSKKRSPPDSDTEDSSGEETGGEGEGEEEIRPPLVTTVYLS